MSKKKTHTSKSKPTNQFPKILILFMVATIVLIMLVVKNQKSQIPDYGDLTPELQYDRYLEEGRPTFVFFHSTNCIPCMNMMQVVDSVYPEFKGEVALVDVNVYDQNNQNLLQRSQIRAIPTLHFFDASGQRKEIIGVMTVDQLRLELQKLISGQ